MEYELRHMSNEEYEIFKKSGCPWRPIKLEDVRVMVMVDGDATNPKADLIEGSFHPNGASGCILMHDEYLCGIRCDHLMWLSGWCEHVGKNVYDPETGTYLENGCLLLVANHKGVLVVSLVYEINGEQAQ